MNDGSPLHTHLLKRGPRRILTSDEEEVVSRPPEAGTPCDCSPQVYATSGSPQQGDNVSSHGNGEDTDQTRSGHQVHTHT